MQARRLPARHGALWLLAGFHLLRANPPLLTLAALAYALIAVLISLLPYVGPFLLPLVMPSLTLMAANVCRAIERGDDLRQSGNFTAGLSERRDALLRLGGLQLIGSLLVLSVSSLLDPGVASLADGKPDTEVMLGVLLRLTALAMPVIIAFWFAPMLTGWDGVAPLKSVFFSLAAALRNWRAFLAYGVAVVLIAVALPAVLIALSSALLPALGAAVAVLLRMLLIFVLTPVLLTGAYLSYRDIFAHE